MAVQRLCGDPIPGEAQVIDALFDFANKDAYHRLPDK